MKTISEFMTKNVETVTNDTPVSEAIAIMKKQNIGAMVIGIAPTDGSMGIFTERDLLAKIDYKNLKDFGRLKVGDVTTKNLVTIDAAESYVHAIEIMKRHKFRHLPVVSNNKLVGIVSLRDILYHYSDDLEKEVERRGKKIKDQLQDVIHAKEVAEYANAAKSAFLSNVSHEIRTPINSIIGFSEIIADSNNPEGMRNQAKTILSEAEILLQLINDLLDFSKIEAEKLILEKAPFDLHDLSRSFHDYATWQAEKRNLEWRLSISDDVPRHVIGDQLRLRQIISNLLNNAFKFTKKGSVELSVETLENDPERVKLRFQIKDTGIGIQKELHKFIFENFTQADGSISRRFGGTGLGTSISKSLAELMGGEIGLDSEYGKGSTFWFTIPFIKASEEEYGRSSMIYGEKKQACHQAKDRITGLILVVDDYWLNIDVVRKHLEKGGHSVETASNGEEALALCGKMAFDLILMDMQMPELDGCATTKRIRGGTSQNSDKPILGLTADASLAAKQACLDAGMNDVITKPIRRDAFLHIVDNWLCQPEGEQPLKPAGKAVEDPVSVQGESEVPFDYDQALKLFDGDSEFLDNMIDKFLKTAKEQIDLIKLSLNKNDADTIRRQAHKMKSGAGNITAMPLSSAAACLEELIKSGRANEYAGQVKKLEEEFVRLEKCVTKT